MAGPGVKIKNPQDFCAGLLFIVCGSAFAWGASGYRWGSSAQPGPGYFPLLLGLLLAVLGAFVLWRSLVLEVDGGGRIGPWAWRPLLLVAGSVVLFGWTLPHLGLFVAVPLLVVGASLASTEWRWRETLLSALVLSIASWAIFNHGLQLRLPLWPAFSF